MILVSVCESVNSAEINDNGFRDSLDKERASNPAIHPVSHWDKNRNST